MALSFKIGFSTSKSLASVAIRWFTKSKVSHTYLVVEGSMFGIPMVLQASTGGFEVISHTKFSKDNEIVTEIPINASDEGFKKSALWLGQNYDFGGLFGSAIVIIGRWFKRRWKNPWQSSKALFCSEYIVRWLQESDVPGAEDMDPSATNPEDLLDFLSTHNS